MEAPPKMEGRFMSMMIRSRRENQERIILHAEDENTEKRGQGYSVTGTGQRPDTKSKGCATNFNEKKAPKRKRNLRQRRHFKQGRKQAYSAGLLPYSFKGESGCQEQCGTRAQGASQKTP